MPRRTTPFVFLLACAFAATCGPAEPQTPANEPVLEAVPERSLGWVGPLATETIEAGEAIDLSVSTRDPEATSVRFLVNGVEVGACDPARDTQEALGPDPEEDYLDEPRATEEPSGECHADDLWRHTHVFDEPGTYTVVAEFRRPDGTVERVERTITVTASEASSVIDPSDPDRDEDDTVPADQLVTEPTDTVVDAITTAGYRDPSRDFHRVFGGREWAVRGQRVVFRSGALNGSVEQVAQCMEAYGAAIRRHAATYYVSHASIVALAIAESNCTNRRPGGPLRVTTSACVAVHRGLTRQQCAQRMRVPDFAIETAIRFIAAKNRRRRHRNDPPKLAAVWRVGEVRESSRDAWRMAAPRGFITRFVQAYNAFRTWERMGANAPRPPVRACGAAWPSDAPPNVGGVRKLGVSITCDDEPLLYNPNGDRGDPANHVIGWTGGDRGSMGSRARVNRGRLALVQHSPGRVNDYYWIDPDLYGATSEDQQRAKFGREHLPVSSADDDACRRVRRGRDRDACYVRAYRTRHPAIGRRGWIRASCVEAAPPARGELPAGPVRCPDGNCARFAEDRDVVNPRRRARPSCDVVGAYFNFRHDPPSITGYTTYGSLVRGAGAVYVGYNIPSVPGGGIVYGYLQPGQAFDVVWEQRCEDHNQFRGVEGNTSHASDAPSRWVYGHGTINGVTGSYGWVRADCLEPRP